MINFAENLNKMITAGLGGETEAPRSEVAIGYRSVYLDASGPVAEFETNVVAPLKRLLVTMEPKQEGSGDPSPENIRPITGYDSVIVTHKGKNILDLSAGTKGTLQPEGTKTFFIGNSGLLPRPDGSFTLSAGQYTFASYGFRYKTFSIYDSTGAIITSSDRDKYTFTIHESGSYVLYFSISPEDFTSWDDVRVMLARGESDGEYEVYQAEAITVQLGETVYGGTLDVLTGKLVIDRAGADLGGLSWSKTSGGIPVEGGYVFHSTSLEFAARNLRSSIYPYAGSVSGNYAAYNAGNQTMSRMRSSSRIYIREDSCSTVPELIEMVSGQLVVYYLETPIEIDLEPHQVIALVGKNYVSSDAGDVSVSYLYYEETEGY